MYAGEQMLFTAYIQERLLLPGERSLGQILGRCRRAHRDGELRTLAHLAPRVEHLGLQPVGKAGREHPAANPGSARRELGDVVDVERGERAADALVQAVLSQKIAVSVRGRRKTARYRDADAGEAGDHFADGRVLAPDEFHVAVSQSLKGDDVGLHGSFLVRKVWK